MQSEMNKNVIQFFFEEKKERTDKRISFAVHEMLSILISFSLRRNSVSDPNNWDIVVFSLDGLLFYGVRILFGRSYVAAVMGKSGHFVVKHIIR